MFIELTGRKKYLINKNHIILVMPYREGTRVIVDEIEFDNGFGNSCTLDVQETYEEVRDMLCR